MATVRISLNINLGQNTESRVDMNLHLHLLDLFSTSPTKEDFGSSFLPCFAQKSHNGVCKSWRKNAHTKHHILLMRLRAKYGLSCKETATTGIVHAAVSGEQNRNMVGSLKDVGNWQRINRCILSLSHAKGGR